VKFLLSRAERDAYWRKLTQVFPRVPAELAFEKGRMHGPNMSHGTSLLTCIFSLDGEQIYAAGGGRLPGCDSSVRVFDSTTGDELLVCRAHIHGIYKLALDPRTRFLASASEDFSVVLWNLEEQDAIFLTGGDPIVKGFVAFATNKPWLAIGETEAYEGLRNSVIVVDLDSGANVFRQDLLNSKEVAGLAISPDGDALFVATANYQHSPKGVELFRWDLSVSQRENWIAGKFQRLLGLQKEFGGKCVWRKSQDAFDVTELHYVPGQRRLAAAIMIDQGDYSSGVGLLDAQSGELLATRVLPGIGAIVAVSPDGQTLAIAYGEGGIELVQAADLTPLRTLAGKASQSSYCSVQFAPNGKTVIAGTALHSPGQGPRGEIQTFAI
jgi:WD40 repeat protein